MKRLLRPTLARRVTLALLGAFALVWIVLLARQFYHATDRAAIDRNLQALGGSLLASIAPLDDAGAARAVIASTATLINDNYRRNLVPGAVLMALRDTHGARVFVSPEAGAASLHGTPGRITAGHTNGRQLRVYAGQSGRWTLLVALPEVDSWWIVKTMAGGLTLDMLIAFPFVLLPTWFAVTRGLRPLHRLSSGIAARSADDLTALGFNATYAELQPLTAALDSLLAQLRQRRAREQCFVQDAAHELRTPLAVIAAQAHVLTGASDPAQRRAAERHLDHAIGRASHLVAQLLTLARIDAGTALEAGTVDVAHLLRQELALLVPVALGRGVELSLDAPDTMPCTLDRHAFVSILVNLVSNALAYVQEEGQVRVGLTACPGGVRLLVADDGPGIPPQQRSLVFERFYRGGASDAPGAGLGLAIVREAAARLHGSVTLADGIDGRGCTFIVSLAAHPAGR